MISIPVRRAWVELYVTIRNWAWTMPADRVIVATERNAMQLPMPKLNGGHLIHGPSFDISVPTVLCPNPYFNTAMRRPWKRLKSSGRDSAPHRTKPAEQVTRFGTHPS